VPLIIRSASAADADAITACDEVAERDPSRARAIARSIDAGQCFAAVVDGQPAGYAVLTHAFFGFGFVEILCVRRNSRRNGIGSALMASVEKHCQSARLFTSTNQSNVAMQRLLTRLGYQPSGRIENLDQDDPELIYMKPVG